MPTLIRSARMSLLWAASKYRRHDTTTPFAKRVDVQICPNQRARSPAIAVRLVLPEEVVPVGRAHDLREMGHQTRWERLKGREVAQALKRFEQDDHPQGGPGHGEEVTCCTNAISSGVRV